MLYFYNQDFSQGCSIEAERFNQALGDFKAKGATVVGVSMDPMEKHEEFCTARAWGSSSCRTATAPSPPSTERTSRSPSRQFSDRSLPHDDKGTVVGHWLERDGSMANVKTPAHTTQILDAIGKL